MQYTFHTTQSLDMSLVRAGVFLCGVYVIFFVYYFNAWNTTTTFTSGATYDDELHIKTPSHVALARLQKKQRWQNEETGMYEWDQHGSPDVFFSVAKEDVCKLFPESPACSFLHEREDSV